MLMKNRFQGPSQVEAIITKIKEESSEAIDVIIACFWNSHSKQLWFSKDARWDKNRLTSYPHKQDVEFAKTLRLRCMMVWKTNGQNVNTNTVATQLTTRMDVLSICCRWLIYFGKEHGPTIERQMHQNTWNDDASKTAKGRRWLASNAWRPRWKIREG